VSPFIEPGNVDLSANVDYETIKRCVDTGDNNYPNQFSFYGLISQKQFLTSMGIGARLMTLLQNCTKEQRKVLIGDADRLVQDMGESYQVFAITKGIGIPAEIPYPFEPTLYK
jgi:SAM-dependent MidA family methyltransferase